MNERITAQAMCGAWSLVSWRIEYPATGRVTQPFGPAAQGLLLYTPDGHMSAALQRPARPKLSRANLSAVVDAEKAAAFDSFLQYSGRWRLEGDSVIHEVELAMNPNLTGSRQVRGAILRGDELELSAIEPLEQPGQVRVHRILWRRARAGAIG